jgi:hypothetical protein
MALVTQIAKAQSQALDTIAEGQQRALEVNDRVAGALKHRVPSVKFPFTGLLPTPTESVKLYFDFAGKLLATNRVFAERFVGAWEPTPAAPKAAASGAAAPAAPAPAATAATRTARKASARKAPATRRAAKAAV